MNPLEFTLGMRRAGRQALHPPPSLWLPASHSRDIGAGEQNFPDLRFNPYES